MNRATKLITTGIGSLLLAATFIPAAFAQTADEDVMQRRPAFNQMHGEKTGQRLENFANLSFEEMKTKMVGHLQEMQERIPEQITNLESKIADLNTKLAELPDEISRIQSATSEADLLSIQKEKMVEGMQNAQTKLAEAISKLEANEDIDAERKAQMLEKMNEHLEEIPTLIDQVNSAETAEELMKLRPEGQKPGIKGMQNGKPGMRKGQRGEQGKHLGPPLQEASE